MHSDSDRDLIATLNLAADAAYATDATAALALDVSANFPLADAFLLLTGSVERNVQAISDAVENALNACGLRTIRREGRESGRWVLLDFGDIIVHIFHAEEREYYQLDQLWHDAPQLSLRCNAKTGWRS